MEKYKILLSIYNYKWHYKIFVCPLFLLLKGKQAVIPAGTSISATVATDTYCNAKGVIII